MMTVGARTCRWRVDILECCLHKGGAKQLLSSAEWHGGPQTVGLGKTGPAPLPLVYTKPIHSSLFSHFRSGSSVGRRFIGLCRGGIWRETRPPLIIAGSSSWICFLEKPSALRCGRNDKMRISRGFEGAFIALAREQLVSIESISGEVLKAFSLPLPGEI